MSDMILQMSSNDRELKLAVPREALRWRAS